jgi:ribosomal protein S18 acetylase RimI-like enzyme
MKPTSLKILIRKCTLADLAELIILAREVYADTFREFNTPENMQAYLDSAFDPLKLEGELNDPGSEFFFLYAGGALAGYLKVNEGSSQTDIHDPDALEIERIYVRQTHQHLGLGQVLIEYAIEIARRKHKRYAWLGVWEKNENAKAFYQHLGFTKVGEHPFVMGTDHQTDNILRLDL